MQKLALMMVVMMLGMPPVNGRHTDIGPGAQGEGGQAEPMFYPSTWIENSRGTLVARKMANPAAPHRDPPMEPGGFSAWRILQHVQLGMENLSEIKVDVQRKGPETIKRTSGRKEWNPGFGGAARKIDPGKRPLRKRWTH